MENDFFRKKWILTRVFFLQLVFLSGLLLHVFQVSAGVGEPKGEKDSINSREKIYIHTDRSAYIAGEDIWFKTYLVDAFSHKPDTKSKIVYVELIDPGNKVAFSKTVKIVGGGAGDFKLPVDLKKGSYTLRAYTNYMRNFDTEWFFRKTILINSLLNDTDDSLRINQSDQTAETHSSSVKPDLQFFPDGGNMVDGFVNRIGFKAVGIDGKGIEISGVITDDSGNKMIDFNTMKFGLGLLKFVPQTNKKYSAKIQYKGGTFSYELPTSLKEGVVMEIIEQKDVFTAIVRSSLPGGVNDFMFFGRQRNRYIGSTRITNNGDGAKITIPKNILREGIVQFTLFDNKGKPTCERLVFVEKNDGFRDVQLSTDKKEYGKRTLVDLEISPIFQLHKPVSSSVSVTGVSGNTYDANGLDIKSYLLLKSDLKGEIEQPGYYFYSDDPQRKMVLDLLMMTQGWRKFILNDSINKDISGVKYPYESGLRISGNVRRFIDQGNPAKADVSLIYSNKDEMVYNQTETDKMGHFVFEDFDFKDSTFVIIQAKKLNKEGDEKIKRPNPNFYITLDSMTIPGLLSQNGSNYKSDVFPGEFYPEDRLSKSEIDSILRAQPKHIILDEVTITGQKIERMRKKRSMYIEPSNSLDFKDIRKGVAAHNIFEAMQGRVAGVNIGDDGSITIRAHSSMSGSSEPLFLLDGIQVPKEVIESIPVDQIDFVDVLKGYKTIVFGSSGSGGVIAVYTLTASDNLENGEKYGDRCILNFKHPGYSIPRKFYEPKYLSARPENDRPDKRNTLYWNSELILGPEGKTKISFYTSDYSGRYRIDLEGITSEGIPIRSEVFFDIK